MLLKENSSIRPQQLVNYGGTTWFWFWKVCFIPMLLCLFVAQMVAGKILHTLSRRCANKNKKVTKESEELGKTEHLEEVRSENDFDGNGDNYEQCSI